MESTILSELVAAWERAAGEQWRTRDQATALRRCAGELRAALSISAPGMSAEPVMVAIDVENADGDGLAVVQVDASREEYGALVALTLTADGTAVMAVATVEQSRQVRTALERAEQHVERGLS